MKLRFVGGPADGQFREVLGVEYEVPLRTQATSAEINTIGPFQPGPIVLPRLPVCIYTRRLLSMPNAHFRFMAPRDLSDDDALRLLFWDPSYDDDPIPGGTDG